MAGQTTFTLDPVIGLSGQLFDNEQRRVVSAQAAEDIPCGRLVEMKSDGTVQLVQGSTLGNLAGVSVYIGMREPGVYAAGSTVPILRNGRCFADSTGSQPDPLAPANVNHSTTTATNRGKFTTTATSSSSGAEIDSVPGTVFVKPTGVSGLCIVDISLPGGLQGPVGPQGPAGP